MLTQNYMEKQNTKQNFKMDEEWKKHENDVIKTKNHAREIQHNAQKT